VVRQSLATVLVLTPCQRPAAQVDPGETPEAALCRELREELSIQVGASGWARSWVSGAVGGRQAAAASWRFLVAGCQPGVLIGPLRHLQVAPGDLTPLAFASHAYDDFHLLMPLYSE
jgi:8-oxo-dGTP pyrophosphatase MutT (NUDIX family)